MPMKRSLAYELLSPVRQQLVLTLKKRGQSDMEALAGELFLSLGAVRQNLAALTAQGIVRYHVERMGPGRPRHIYELSGQGQRLFPTLYDEVAIALAEAVIEKAPEQAGLVFERVTNKMLEGLLPRVEGKRPEMRVRELVRVLDEYGYMPEAERTSENVTEVTVYHCPIYSLARRRAEVCDAELRCLQTAAGRTKVARLQTQVGGDPVCVYRFESE